MGVNHKEPLTSQQWAQLRAEYERGEYVAVLARKFNVDRSTIQRRAKKDNWRERGALHQQAVAEAQAKVADTIAATYRRAALAANDRHLKLYRAVHGLSARLLRLVEANLNEADPKKRAKLTSEIYALQSLTATIRGAADGERCTLQLDRLDLNGLEREDGFSKLCDLLQRTRDARGQKLDSEQGGDHD